MTRTKLALAAAAIALLSASEAQAQAGGTCTTNPCTLEHTATVTVNDVLRLSLDNASTNLGTPTEADYDAQFKDASGPTATVKANRAWKVQVVAKDGATAAFTGASYAKPASDLKWQPAGASGYANNMSAPATLVSGATGTASTSKQILFETKYDWTKDVPGTYNLVVNFTLSAP